MGRVWAAAFLLRRLRAERGLQLLILGLVGVTSFLGAAAPRLYNAAADAGLRHTLADASPARGNIELSQDAALPANEDAPELLDRMARTWSSLFPDSVRPLIGAPVVVATSPRFRLVQLPRYTTFVTLRQQTGIEDEVRLTEGRWPASTGEKLPAAPTDQDPDGGEPPEEPPRIEIAVSEPTVEEAGLEVGQVFDAHLDGSDPLLFAPLVQPLEVRFEIVGIFAIEDPDAAVWYGDNRLERVGALFSLSEAFVYVTALVAPEAYPELLASNLPFRYSWRYFVDPGRLDAGVLEATDEGLRRLETTFPRSTLGTSGTDLPFLRTDLVAIISRYLAQRSASDAVLAMAAIGPAALGGAAVGMLAVLLNSRRRSQLALTRERGASGALILAAQAWEGVVIAGVGALVGYVAAVLLVPGRPSDLSPVAAFASGLGVVIMLTVAAAIALRRPVDRAARLAQPPPRITPRRLVLEGTAVGLAILGIALLQQRGLTIGPAGREVVRFDPFLAAVPMLAGFAAGLVTARLYPLPVRALGWIAARRRDLVPVLGLRNVSRQPAFATVPLLVLLSTAAFASFALVVMSGIERGQVEASWRAVGADYRIATEFGRSLRPVDAAAVEGVEAVAPAVVNPSVSVSSGEFTFARSQLIAIDTAAYAEVAEGPIEPGWPAELLAPPAGPIGTPDNPVPAILSQEPPQSGQPRRVGDVIRVRVGQGTVLFKVVEIRPAVGGVTSGGAFLVASIDAVEAAAPDVLEPNVLFVRGPESAAGGLAAALAEDDPGETVLESRHTWLTELQTAPLIGVVANGFRVALVAAVAYAAIAIVGALVLAAAGRTQDLAFLRPLGLSPRQVAGIMIVEHGLPILLALVPGIAIGIALGYLLESSLGLNAFLGGGTYRIDLDWAGLATVAGLLVVLVALSVAAGTWLAQRAPVMDALRAGDA